MTFFQEEKTCENDAEISNNFEIKQTKQKMIYQSKSNCNLSKQEKKLKKSKANTKSKNENSFFKKKYMKYGNKVLSLSKQFFLLNFFENGVCDSRSLKNYYFFVLCMMLGIIYMKKKSIVEQYHKSIMTCYSFFPLKRLLEIQSSSLQELLTFFVV